MSEDGSFCKNQSCPVLPEEGNISGLRNASLFKEAGVA